MRSLFVFADQMFEGRVGLEKAEFSESMNRHLARTGFDSIAPARHLMFPCGVECSARLVPRRSAAGFP
jgi:hypothetical protein